MSFFSVPATGRPRFATRGGGVGADVSCNPKLKTTRFHGLGKPPVAPRAVEMLQQANLAESAPVFEGACCNVVVLPFSRARRTGK